MEYVSFIDLTLPCNLARNKLEKQSMKSMKGEDLQSLRRLVCILADRTAGFFVLDVQV